MQYVADTLPHLVTDLTNIIVVKLQEEVAFKYFVVRRDNVLNALLWLKKNNPHYADIKIDSQKVNLLPSHDNVHHQLKMSIEEELSEDVKNAIDEGNTDCDDTENTEEIDDEDDIVYTSVPDSNHPSVSKSFKNELGWPEIGSMPLNEFSSPGYLSMAFPHLFPFGTCDYSMPRDKKVSLKEYIHHLMLYKDQRFAKDERFRYFIMNTEMRWESLNIGNVYVEKNT